MFASLSNWREGQKTTSQRHSLGPPSTPTSASAGGNEGEQQHESGGSACEQAPERDSITAGSLIVEPYSWKSVQSDKSVLRLTTTGTKGTTVTLPPGLVIVYSILCPVVFHCDSESLGVSDVTFSSCV